VLVGLAASLVFAWLSVRNVDFGDLETSLARTNYWWLVPASATFVLAFFIRALRWQLLFAAPTRPAFWSTFQALLVGQFFNNVLPLRAGDAARILALHSLGRQSRAEATGTVLIERFLDVLALILVFLLALPWLPHVTWLRSAGLLGLALISALLLTAIVLRVLGNAPIRFALGRLGRVVSPRRVDAAARNFALGLVALRSARVGLLAMFLTMLSWALLAISFWFVMVGFDLGLSPAAGLLTIVATGLSLILPSAPAAVGVFEGAVILSLAAYGIPQGRSLSYALVVHALNVLPFIGAGLLVLGLQRRTLFPQGRLVGGRRPASYGERILGSEGRSPSRSADEQNNVAEPAERDLEVGDLRKSRRRAPQ
jgi:uncharacterized protein (TIRG00374 family)